jgi:hypothetical protein
MAARYYGSGLGWDRRLIEDLLQQPGLLRCTPDVNTVQSNRDDTVNQKPDL